MGRPSIEIFNPSDTQSSMVSKLNHNFNELVGSYGGTLGDKGPTGEMGIIGSRGPAGATGHSGKRGDRWFIQSASPTGPDINYGDYWLDANFDSYEFGASGWTYTATLTRDTGLFDVISDTEGLNGVTGGSVLVMNQILPQNYSFVFGDNAPGTVSNLNPEGSKFVISTDPFLNSSYILEFKTSLYDLAGSTGATSDFVNHPFFSWYGGLGSGNLELSNPENPIFFQYGGTAGTENSTKSDLILNANSGDINMGILGSYTTITSSDAARWTAGNDIKILTNTDVNIPSSFLMSTPNIFISYISVVRGVIFGKAQGDGIQGLYDVTLSPNSTETAGYVSVDAGQANQNGDIGDIYSVPFRVSKFFDTSNFLSFSDTNVPDVARFMSSGLTGPVGTLEAFRVKANGRISTMRTSERYVTTITTPFRYRPPSLRA
jgi:hypothetical protein